jgi:Mrp family chromosome partitioning ATPase
MESFIARAKTEFDFILMDTPPIAIVTDAILLTRYSDANIFVIRHNYSPRDVLYLVDELSFKRNIPNLGILINDVKVTSYYAYGKKYSYNYGYGDVYNDYYSDHKKYNWRQRMIRKILKNF